MNKLNIKKAIAVMERVQADGRTLDMECWQREGDDHAYFEAKATYEEFEKDCGTACCFAGWIAVSPEFQSDGGIADKDCGRPMISRFLNPDPDSMDAAREIVDGEAAIAEWLDITCRQAGSLCGLLASADAYPNLIPLYNRDDIDIDDVLTALHSLHDNGRLPGE